MSILGQSISHYLISKKLGEGGMGEVYRATDTRLNREVAIKVLSASIADESGRLARLRREALVLASFSHPNIAAIHGLEESRGKLALVMELVEGEDLSERIARGAVASAEALSIAVQIARALEAAHRRGIIHRDLKPANIKITPDGTVKVLDFGLAKVLEPTRAQGEIANTPTFTMEETQAGTILGTFRYMSPEQARGQELDRRTDIWAFGCVLFELLTGRKAFPGDLASDVLASILKTEPDYGAMPARVDVRIRRIVQRCLQKDLGKRFQDIGDVRVEIEEVLAGAQDETGRASAASVRRVRSWSFPALVVSAVAGAAIAALLVWNLRTETPRLTSRFAIPAAKGVVLQRTPWNDVAVSRKGDVLAYMGLVQEQSGIYLRPVNDLQSTLLSGSQGRFIWSPFFAPDGSEIGFFDRLSGELKRISVRGGTPVTICRLPAPPFGASWGADGNILFGGERSGLFRVAALGGEPVELTALDPKKDELRHILPSQLPGQERVLFTVVTSRQTEQVALLDVDSGKYRTLVEGSNPHYSASGHIVYGRAGALWAIRFDPDAGETSGQPVRVVENVMTSTGAIDFDLSENGDLFYVQGGAPLRNEMVWVNETGDEQAWKLEPGFYRNPAFSPDGTRVALGVFDPSDLTWDLWIYDLLHTTQTRLTRDPGNDIVPLWTPDGQRIVFSSDRGGTIAIYWKRSDGTGPTDLLASGPKNIYPACWASKGQFLIFNESDNGNANIGILSMDDPLPRPLLQTELQEMHPAVSPNGHWLAYESNESGQSEIYVRPFPDIEDWRKTVSTGGGEIPLWSPDGMHLYYFKGPQFMAVPVGAGPNFTHGVPHPLFEGTYTSYSVSPDGRLLMIKPSRESQNEPPPEMVLVQNWSTWLKNLVTSSP